MAGFFAAGTSSILKRLCRYAFNKIDLFEDSALDFDQHEIRLGVFEFNDLAVKVEKLEKYITLPPAVVVQQARVRKFKLTIPSDFYYSSSCTVEVVGLEVKARVSTVDPTTTAKPSRGSASVGAEAVLTAADLAQSFIDVQTIQQRRELENVLAAEAQDGAASTTLSDNSSDGGSAYGAGQGFSLPAFMTNFINGCLDRAEVVIQDVSADVVVELPGDALTTTPDTVTLQLCVEQLSTQGLASTATHKRHLEIVNSRFLLESEASLFSTMSRSPSALSSATSQSPTNTERSAPSRQASDLSHRSVPSFPHPLDLEERIRRPLEDSEDAFNIPYDLEDAAVVSVQEQEEDYHSRDSTPRASVSYKNRSLQYLAPDSLRQSVQELDITSQPSSESSGRGNGRRTPPDIRELEMSLMASGSDDDDLDTGSVEDLTQSRIYSQAEAGSMYMSAISQAPINRSTGHTMPGGWGSKTPSPDMSPRLPRAVLTAVSDSVVPERPLDVKTQGESVAQVVEPRPTVPEALMIPSEPLIPSTQILATQEPPAMGSTVDVRSQSIPPPTAPRAVTPEGMVTPKGTNTLIKELVTLDTISIELPPIGRAFSDEADQPSTDMAKSTAQNLPGAFSTYSVKSTEPPLTSPVTDAPRTDSSDIDITLGILKIAFDLPTVFILAKVVSRLTESFNTAKIAKTSNHSPTTSEHTSRTMPRVHACLTETMIILNESKRAISPVRGQEGTSASPGSDILLILSVHKLKGDFAPSDVGSEGAISLEKFTFGYTDSDIISFDRRAQVRASSAESVMMDNGTAVSVNLTIDARTTRFEITTLPLLVCLDLSRLEETFKWSGGFSSFLKMSSSMVASVSPPPSSPKKLAKRGVRFEMPIEPEDKSAQSENKIDLRVAGLQLDLVGSECKMAVTTTALKMVSRGEGVGIGISQVQLMGPFQDGQGGSLPINILLNNTRLEFLFTPKDQDLDRLLGLIVPSKGQFDDNDGAIMVDTLLKQRRKGSVLRLTVDHVDVKFAELHRLQVLNTLGEELARLSTVAKYLPEDDRPGLLTLTLLRITDVSVDLGGRIGILAAQIKDAEIAQISLPSLVALAVGSVSLSRNQREELLHSVGVMVPGQTRPIPEITMRIIGDEMEPVIKIRLTNMGIEYRVQTIIDLLGMDANVTPQEFEDGLSASIADLGGRTHAAINRSVPTSKSSPSMSKSAMRKPTVVDVAIRDCIIGLNPMGRTSKMLVTLTDAHLEAGIPKDENISVVFRLSKAVLLLIDDISSLSSTPASAPRPHRRSSDAPQPVSQVSHLCQQGYANICQISSASVSIEITVDSHSDKHVNVEIRDELLVLETCADSTQTMIALANALKPPTPPSVEVKYKTAVVPIQDMLASITADAFGTAEGDYDFDQDFGLGDEFGSDYDSSTETPGMARPNAAVRSFHSEASMGDELFDAAASSLLSRETVTPSFADTFPADFGSRADNKSQPRSLKLRESFYGAAGSTAEQITSRWNSANDAFDQVDSAQLRKTPLQVRMRDVHVIWNLYDGYDWQHTRDAITKTVQQVETKAFERQARRYAEDDEQDEVIGDFLFNSIYIGIAGNHDPRELAHNINQDIDRRSETESLATTAITATTARAAGAFRSKSKKLRLNRGRRNKITFELKGIDVDFVSYPPGAGEMDSSVDVKVRDLVVYDRVPTSTWKKFAAYDQDKGPREMHEPMVHLELMNVKPVPELAATEIVLRVAVLPLRLHVDQDALDFITRFFEFKDDAAPTHSSPADVPFIQRAEIMSIPVKLDFKPKRVDYAGLRSGHTTEFMNFLVLDTSRMTMRHAIIYGVSGFDRLGKTLNDIWMPDVKNNQLPGVLAGVAPVRSLVNVGSGFRDLISIPIQEYKKDGRVVRSIGKGAAAFAQTTGTELVKLGAKLAVGTQYVLQGAEGLLVANPDQQQQYGTAAYYSPNQTGGWDPDADMDDPNLDTENSDILDQHQHQQQGQGQGQNQISLYANQPTNVVQGLQHAYHALSRDLRYARDAIIAVPGEVKEAEGAAGAARAVLRRTPTIVLRPAIGASKAVGGLLMGAQNVLDPENLRRVEDKYKSGPSRR